MNFTSMEEELIRDEGLHLRPYTCSAGHLTIGVGHKITGRESIGDTISLEVAGRLLTRDIADALGSATRVFNREIFESLPDSRQRAIVNMLYNLGEERFVGFKNMVAAIKDGRWDDAAAECLNSKYARQVGNRARRVAKQFLEPGE